MAIVNRKRKNTSSGGGGKKQKKISSAVASYNNVWTAPAPNRVELKYDVGQVTDPVLAAGEVRLLTTIANGAGADERIGRRIAYHDIEISWLYDQNAAHGVNYSKFWIVYDDSPVKALPAFTDIMVSAVPFTLQNPDTKGRFKIMYESMYTSYIDNTATQSAVVMQQASGHKVISLKGKTAQFTGITNTIGSIEKGAVYLVNVSYANAKDYFRFQNKIQYSDA